MADKSSPGSHKMSPEDLQTVSKLYQKCPQLWAEFRDIIDFVDILSEHSQAYRKLYDCLVKIEKHITTRPPSEERTNDLFRFCVAVGFVEQNVNLSRQIMRELGRAYNTELPDFTDVRSSFDIRCLNLIRNLFLNFTCDSPDFRLRLAQTGFLQDLVQDLMHIQHLSAQALERGNVFLTSMGTIHNCCMHPDVVVMVKQMDIIQYITPFLGKKCENCVVSTVTITTLSYVVEDHQLDLIRLDAELLQFFLDDIRASVTTRKSRSDVFNDRETWKTEEILCGLTRLARNDFNKRLIVAQGAVGTVVLVLDSSNGRGDEEKQFALDLITQLVQEQLNVQVCKIDKKLATMLKALQTSRNAQITERVNNLLVIFEQRASKREESLPNSPHIAELLADGLNMLTILDMGKVEFVLDQLNDTLTTEKDSCSSDGTGCVKVLQALTELAQDNVYRQQIMAMGGLDSIKAVLQRGHTKEQYEAGKTVLNLMTSQENCAIIKHTLLGSLTQNRDSTNLRQLAENILQSLGK